MADGNILALDVGAARIGLAVASTIARLANPYKTIPNNDQVFDTLRQISKQEQVRALVVGLPRGLQGQETEQTAAARSFGEKAGQALELPVTWQDETLTSVKAEAELDKRKERYSKQDIDALAATYILEDYLREHV